MRDYQIISPSLEGVLSHDFLVYEGIRRPTDLLRVLDGPSSKGSAKHSDEENNTEKKVENRVVLEQYFHDLYGIFMKKLSHFAIESESSAEEIIKLQAMLSEMIKIKKLIRKL